MAKQIPQTHVNKDGSPDMRTKENRDDPEKVAEANEKKTEIENGSPGEGHNKNGEPDMRLKENRDNPRIAQGSRK